MIKITDLNLSKSWKDIEDEFENMAKSVISWRIERYSELTNTILRDYYERLNNAIYNDNMLRTLDLSVRRGLFTATELDSEITISISDTEIQEITDIANLSNNNNFDVIKEYILNFADVDSFKSLRNVKAIVESLVQNRSLQQNEILDLKRLMSKTKRLKEIMLKDLGYEKFREKYGYDFVKSLEIKTCPYCNSQNIFTVKKTANGQSNETKKALCQLDHFYTKTDYAHLSVCMYNLIPSCSTCNHSKGKENNGGLINFYLGSFHDNVMFKVNTEKNLDALISSNYKNLEEIEILPTADELVDKTKYDDQIAIINDYDRLFALKSIYQHHIDIASELYMKHYIYTDKYKKELIDLLKNDFTGIGESEINRFILGNYTEEKDFLKRPLSKLTHDIAKELGLLD